MLGRGILVCFCLKFMDLTGHTGRPGNETKSTTDFLQEGLLTANFL